MLLVEKEVKYKALPREQQLGVLTEYLNEIVQRTGREPDAEYVKLWTLRIPELSGIYSVRTGGSIWVGIVAHKTMHGVHVVRLSGAPVTAEYGPGNPNSPGKLKLRRGSLMLQHIGRDERLRLGILRDEPTDADRETWLRSLIQGDYRPSSYMDYWVTLGITNVGVAMRS